MPNNWRRNLRTSANAGNMSGNRTVPVNVADLDACLAELERLGEIEKLSCEVVQAFREWRETPQMNPDDDMLNSLSDLETTITPPTPASAKV
jgi:predicted TPR repeat methyltransferase